jgi:copper resistance protein C
VDNAGGRLYLEDVFPDVRACRRADPFRKLDFQRSKKMRTLSLIAFALVAALFTTGAQAHAFLDHANPQVGSTVQTAPSELTLWFTQNLEPAFSSVQVTGPDGARVDAGKPQISGTTMRIAIKAAGPGTYHVQWHALSVDTHTTQGSYTFTVGGK